MGEALGDLHRDVSGGVAPPACAAWREGAEGRQANDAPAPHALSGAGGPARLGQFQYGPEDSPWYGVSFATTEAAKAAYSLAVDLAEAQLPRLVSMANEIIEQTTLRHYETISELGVYLRLLLGIRETLDRFTPAVYDRSLTEVIAAHAPRGGDDMSGANRKRLRKLAREYVRPGVHVSDMYAQLVKIQQQRVLWQRYSTVAGTPPQAPLGIADVATAYQAAYQDLDELDRVLGHEHDSQKLRSVPLATLARKTTDLARESEVLHNIQERTAIVERLRAAHLEPLIDDLSARHVPADQVSFELEQAWWQSVLESMLQSNQALLAANTGVVERLEAAIARWRPAELHWVEPGEGRRGRAHPVGGRPEAAPAAPPRP